MSELDSFLTVLKSQCHAERNREESEAILTMKSKHRYLLLKTSQEIR